MTIIEPTSGMDPKVKAAMQEACDRIAKGIPFSRQERQEACDLMDQIREKNRKLFGVQNIAVDLVREMRDSR